MSRNMMIKTTNKTGSLTTNIMIIVSKLPWFDDRARVVVVSFNRVYVPIHRAISPTMCEVARNI